MAKIKGAIVVDTERCKGCNLCVVACPLDVIALNKEVNIINAIKICKNERKLLLQIPLEYSV